jgi:glycosyl transferase family 2
MNLPPYLPNPWHELLESLTHLREYPWFSGRLRYLRDFTRWQRQVRHQGPLPAPGPQRLTVILLSYRRVRNMEPLVESLLRTDFVGHVVVSNNNPAYRISDWVRLRDERLQLVDQPVRRHAGVRFELARSAPGDYFASIDDDIFLLPSQVEHLFRSLLADSSVPHGLQGESHDGEHGPEETQGWRVNLRGEQRVDSINRVYFFTREHLTELYRLAGLLGLEVGNMSNGEDLLLSSCGQARPLVHEVGKVTDCLSACRRGVAISWTHQHFFQERTALLARLRALKPL